MVVIGNGIEQALSDRLFRSMFEERKRVFVDLLGWDIPVLAGRYEIDQFDDDEATYIVVTDGTGEHCGSARLLRTDRPHILDTIFPHLCDDIPPAGPTVLEITRFCLARRLKARERLATRNRLVSALVEHALCTASRHIPALLSGRGFSRFSHLVGNAFRSGCRATPTAACLRCG